LSALPTNQKEISAQENPQREPAPAQQLPKPADHTGGPLRKFPINPGYNGLKTHLLLSLANCQGDLFLHLQNSGDKPRLFFHFSQ
jgi:hypothetical protein